MTERVIPGPSTDVTARVFQFVTTVQASLDARALLHSRLDRLDLIVYTLAVLIGLAWVAYGDFLGLVIVIVGAIALANRRFQLLERLLIARNGRGLLGKRTEVTIGADGFRFWNEVATTYVPWSSLTAVRSNTRSVLFLIDRAIAGYIPASAFSSPSEQADVVRFVEERIAGHSRVNRG